VGTDASGSVRSPGRRGGWFDGMKPCGAVGGGCCLLVVKEGRREEAIQALAALSLPVLPVGLTAKGTHRV